ncbi:MAG: hypothetical protein GEU73_08615 [Chloroflexi bacterium]|nr:hypothetical protein [Chloroflexota bacterium]
MKLPSSTSLSRWRWSRSASFFVPWLGALRASGYTTHLAFLPLPSQELALSRVTERVRLGGHNVPDYVVRRRYARGLRNFFTVYRDAVDIWQMFDNSRTARPFLVASGRAGQAPEIRDSDVWQNLSERQQ